MKPNPVVISYPPSHLVGTYADELHAEIHDALEVGIKTFLIDFQAVDFVDSHGLGILVTIRRKVYAAGGQMFLCSLNEQARMLLELTNTQPLFDILNNQAEFQEQVLGG